MCIGEGSTLSHNEQHTTTICYQLTILNGCTHVEYGTINILGATNRVALGIVARVALRSENNAEGNILAPNDLGRGCTLSNSLENICDVAVNQWQHDLSLRVTKASIELDNLHAIRSLHQTTIQHTCEWTSLLNHRLCSRAHNLLHSKFEVLIGDEWQRGISTHTARIRALIAVKSTLMVLCNRHRVDILTLHEAHQRELWTCQEILYNHTTLAEAVIQEHISQRLTSLVHRLGNNYSLTCCQAVILQYSWQWSSLDISHSLVVVVERLISCGWDIVLRHQLLGKLLARLDASSSLCVAKDWQASLAELVGNTHSQSCLRAYNGQIDGILQCEGLQTLDIGILNRYALSLLGNTRISGCAVYLIYAR